MLRALAAAAAAMVAVSGAAEAARLTTPIFDNLDWQSDCRLSYFGRRRDIQVRVTFVGYADQPAHRFPVTRNFKMGPANRAVQLRKQCDPVAGDLGCEKFRCVFEVPNNIYLWDFVGNACGIGRLPGQVCAAAVQR